MKDFELKKLISKLTGVNILSPYKTAMPLLSGQMTLKNRQLTWHRFNVSQIPDHLPLRMKNEMSSFINRYVSAYKQYVSAEMQQDFSSMMFAWYAEDSSIGEDDFKRLQESTHPHKDKLVEVANFIQARGVPLAKSQVEFNQTRSVRDKEGGYNGGEVHAQNYGWAWGAKEAPSEDNGERRFHKFLSPKQKNDPTFIESVYAKNGVIVQVTTAQVENGWGIFFTDGQEILPVIPEAAIKKMQELGGTLSPDSTMNKEIMRGFGNIHRWFAHRSENDPTAIASFRPNERRFLLDNEQDPKPKAIYWFNANEGGKKVIGPAFDGRHRGMFEQRNKYNKRESIDSKVYTLMIRANGTLYWQNEADKKITFNATQEQVDFFNHTKGNWLVLTEPGYKKFSFDDPNLQKKYYDDCYYLNELRDFITSTSGRWHVASQSYQVILVGPRFTAADQVGPNQTPGYLYHPEQEAANIPLEEHSGEFTGKRDDWVLEKHEFYISTFREAMMKGKFDAPTSEIGPALSDGMVKTCNDAVQRAISKYHIPNSVLPSGNEIKAAQSAFDNAQTAFTNQFNQINNDLNNQVNPAETLENNEQNGTENQINDNSVPQQNVENKENTDVLNKSSKDILFKIKKLGKLC